MVNRGFAVLGDRLFMTTLDAHIMALDRKTGTRLWDVAMIYYRLGYSSTVAPQTWRRSSTTTRDHPHDTRQGGRAAARFRNGIWLAKEKDARHIAPRRMALRAVNRFRMKVRRIWDFGDKDVWPGCSWRLGPSY